MYVPFPADGDDDLYFSEFAGHEEDRVVDLTDLERDHRRQPRDSMITSAGRTSGSLTDPRFAVPLVLFLAAVLLVGMALRSRGSDTTPVSEPAVAGRSELAQSVLDAQLRAGFDGLTITDQGDGTIIIEGTAVDATTAASIGAVARSVEGTQRVDNRVVVPGGEVDTVAAAPAQAPAPSNLGEQLAGVEQITFEVGSADLTAEGDLVVDGVASLLTQSPGAIVAVHGHTDSDGDSTTNQVLSQARAEAVVNALVARGIDANRLSAVGFGESQPIAPNITEEGRATNRRIEFVVTG